MKSIMEAMSGAVPKCIVNVPVGQMEAVQLRTSTPKSEARGPPVEGTPASLPHRAAGPLTCRRRGTGRRGQTRKSIAGVKTMPWNATAKGEIFVIDDDIAIRVTLTAALQGAGYHAICFAGGAALLSQMRLRMPVCVLLEVRMPNRDGLDILKKLRAENCPVPIFVTS